ncbi:Trm112p-like protein [Spironucleus salmonicida]|uniref:Trm112p-like protein n=1 Tax=Spironucleus salmonicida TaxID=348837 RepID=V6LPN5_9EUKA|nr:Trm112p-like protein [Spironucleus salmonicida]|eukprot:EST45661.1 Trm112p-like protein [Spironucleus salmonicida]
MVLLLTLKTMNCKDTKCKSCFKNFNINQFEIETVEREYNPDLLKFLCLQTEYEGFYNHCKMLNIDMPEQVCENNDSFNQAVYNALYNIEIINANLECPLCGLLYEIRERIFIV